MENNANQIKIYFEELAKIRASNLDKVQKQSLKNAPINILYELIQNADNTQATYVTFELYRNNLVFKHNGKKHFTISNPANEEEDLKNNKLGDVNAITLIANFSKIEPKIGNIGYGIKSVFEYTKSIFIYDPNFCFKIDQYVIPSLLTEDYNGRQNDETIIVIPLNPTVFNQIATQLKNMNYPNLFLQTITIINYTIENQKTNKITRNIELEMNLADIKVQYISFIHQNGDNQSHQRFWVFTRLVKSYPISLAFLTSDDGFLKPLSKTFAYCFFPTSEMTYLNFLINAPFLLTIERTKIKPDETHNQLMIAELASLSAKSLTIFKDIGQKYDIKLINDNILSIFPVNKDCYSANKISFNPFVDEIQKVFLSEEIIPTEKGFTSKKNAYWTPDPALLDLINNEQLTILVNNPNAKWVFRTLNGKNGQQSFNFICSIVQTEICDYTLFNSEKKSYRFFSSSNSNKSFSQKPLPDFIDCFDPTSNDENLNPFASCELKFAAYLSAKSTSNNIEKSPIKWGTANSTGWGSWKKSSSDLKIIQPFGNKENAENSNPIENEQNKRLFKGISAEFIEKQSFEWLNSFYKWICLDGSRISMAKTNPIFLDQNKKAVAAFDPQNKNLQLFFPVIQKEDQNYMTVNPTLFKNEENFLFMRKIGISVPFNIKNYIFNYMLKQANMIKLANYNDCFKKIIFYYQFCSFEERSSLIESLKNTEFLLFNSKESKTIQKGKPDTLYLPNQILISYFDPIPQTRFICIDKYKNIFGENKEQEINNFLLLLGVRPEISIIETKVNCNDIWKYNIRLPYATYGHDCEELRIEGFNEVFETIQKFPFKSITLWNVLLHLSKNDLLKKFYEGTCKYFFRKDLTVEYPSIFRLKLINEKWLITSKNEFVSPNEIFLKELPKEYNIDDPAIPALADFLNIKKRNVDLLTSEYIKDHDFVERAKKAGLFEKFIKELETKEAESKK